MSSSALQSLLVVEMGDSVAGAYAGKLFADYGSEVHLVGAGPLIQGGNFFCSSKHINGPDLLNAADVVIQASSTDPIEQAIEPANPQQISFAFHPLRYLVRMRHGDRRIL